MQPGRTHILVAHLLRSEVLIKRAIDRLLPADIAKVGGPVLGYIWSVAVEHYRGFECALPQHTLIAVLSDWLADNQMDELTIEDAVEFVDWAYTLSEKDMNVDEALQYMRDILEETRVRGPLVDALGDGRTAAEVLDIVQTGLTAASVTVGEPISPLSTLDQLVGQRAPEPLGGSEIMYFNKMLHGGVLPGEIAVLLGPTGGFKTTMAVDIVCAMARMQERSAYFLFEQSYSSGDMPIRFLARMTGISRDRLMSVGIKDLLPEEQAKIGQARQIEGYIHVFDRTQTADTIEDVAEMVHQLCVSGRKPKLVVIDQALAWLEGAQLLKDSKNENSLRNFLRSMVIELKHKVAERFGTTVLLMHQVVAEKTSRSAGHKFSGNDSAECKSMPFWTDYELVLCNICESSGCLYALTKKARRGKNIELILKADGQTCHLEEVENMELDVYSGKFILKGTQARTTKASKGIPEGPKPSDDQ